MTIEVPTPSAELLIQIETQTIETNQTEAAAFTAIRERFTPYAKHNGTIKIADYDMATSNYRVDREAFYKVDGKKVRAMLADDSFDYNHTDQNRGTRCGTRLYLTEQGGWLELRRVGNWTRWQGEAQWWYTDADSKEAIELGDGYDDAEEDGAIRTMTDAEVASKYSLDKVIETIGKSMAEMCSKLPARYAKLKLRAELAGRVIAATQEVK